MRIYSIQQKILIQFILMNKLLFNQSLNKNLFMECYHLALFLHQQVQFPGAIYLEQSIIFKTPKFFEEQILPQILIKISNLFKKDQIQN
ncbi:unnamed protein product [Paramecium sonneborni]|uniref:Uncharacterized protein n=1 Tax=Paramecium sonneborni TaxID=65129 RepID=A0A8S1QJ25_9CILI|nr:unnamed protein product [Paramecium sonneborni]